MSITSSLVDSPVLADGAARRPGYLHRLAGNWPGVWPGVVLAAIIASAALSARELPGLAIFSPMILAVIVGIVFSNLVGTPANTAAGIAFCQRSLLRFAIVLLGFQLTATQLASIGLTGIGVAATTLLATFCFTVGLGRLLGVDRKLAELIAAGTSICGASAIVATNTVTLGRDEDVAYAVACVTAFGTVAMLGYPLVSPFLGLDQHHYGLWAGTSIHEVAQVIGAAFQGGTQAGEIGTVAKLSRVAMLAPVVIGLGLLACRGHGEEGGVRPPMPWFVVAFVAVVAFNSVVVVPAEVKSTIALVATALLTVGLAAMGLQTDIRNIRLRGLRPLLLALSAFVFIACFSLVLVKLVA